MTLTCEDLQKSYGDHRVLRDCGLRVERGDCVVIRGRSGGGKSTLLRILALLESANAGVVLHGPRRFVQPRSEGSYPDEAHPFVTMVFQQLFLWPHLTLRQNTALALTHSPRSELRTEWSSMYERLGILEQIDKRPHECSLGQRQRAALARSLLLDTEFLLLDEPTSALDRDTRTIVRELLTEEKAKGRGLVAVSHDERDFEGLCDRMLELEQGTLREL